MNDPPTEESVLVCSKVQTIKSVCDSLLPVTLVQQQSWLATAIRLPRPSLLGRAYTESQCISVFIRDGFIDRYYGTRLVFPALFVCYLVSYRWNSHTTQLEDERNPYGVLGAISDR